MSYPSDYRDFLSSVFCGLPTTGQQAYQESSNQASGGTGGFTKPANGQPIGQLIDPIWGIQFAQATDIDRPTLTSQGGVAMYAFNGTQPQWLQSNQKTDAFAFLHQGGVYTIHGTMYATANTTGKFFSTSTGATGAGITLGRQSTTRLTVFLYDGTTTLLNYTQANAVVGLNSVVRFHIVVNGTGTGKAIVYTCIDGSSEVTGTATNVTATSSTTACSQEAVFGASTASGGSPFFGNIGDLVIQKSAATLTERAAYRTWQATQVQNNASLVRQTVDGASIAWYGCSAISHAYRFGDIQINSTGNLYSDAFSTPVSADGDNLKGVRNAVELKYGLTPGILHRDLRYDTGSHAAPKYKTNQVNSLAAGLWAGAPIDASTRGDNNLICTADGSTINYFSSGDCTLWIAAKNAIAGATGGNGTTGHVGSIVLGDSTGSRLMILGTNYENTGAGRWVSHFQTNGSTGGALQQVPETWNVLCIRKNNTKITGFCNLVTDSDATSTLTGSGNLPGGNFGIDALQARFGLVDPTANPTFEMNGNIYAIYYAAADVGADLAQKVARGLLDELAVPYVVPPSTESFLSTLLLAGVL